MKDIKNEIDNRFYHNWCDEIIDSTSVRIDILIKDGFFILNLSNGIKLGLK